MGIPLLRRGWWTMNLKGGRGRPPGGVGLVQQAQGAPVVAVEAEIARVAPEIFFRTPLAGRGLPDDLHRRVALAQRVQAVLQPVHEPGPPRELAHRVGHLHVRLFVGGRLHGRLQAGDGALAGAEHGGVVQVALLHLLGQGQVVVVVALGGRGSAGPPGAPGSGPPPERWSPTPAGSRPGWGEPPRA